MQKKDNISVADFYKIAFFSKWLLVVIFAMIYQKFNLILLITNGQMYKPEKSFDQKIIFRRYLI